VKIQKYQKVLSALDFFLAFFFILLIIFFSRIKFNNKEKYKGASLITFLCKIINKPFKGGFMKYVVYNTVCYGVWLFMVRI